jgi:hypothetical protein
MLTLAPGSNIEDCTEFVELAWDSLRVESVCLVGRLAASRRGATPSSGRSGCDRGLFGSPKVPETPNGGGEAALTWLGRGEEFIVATVCWAFGFVCSWGSFLFCSAASASRVISSLSMTVTPSSSRRGCDCDPFRSPKTLDTTNGGVYGRPDESDDTRRLRSGGGLASVWSPTPTTWGGDVGSQGFARGAAGISSGRTDSA